MKMTKLFALVALLGVMVVGNVAYATGGVQRIVVQKQVQPVQKVVQFVEVPDVAVVEQLVVDNHGNVLKVQKVVQQQKFVQRQQFQVQKVVVQKQVQKQQQRRRFGRR
jgi:hypothetical protein